MWAEKRSGGRWRGGCESVWECVRGPSDLTCSVGDATGASCHSYTDKPRQNEARQDPFQISWRSTRDQPFTHWWGKSKAVVMVMVQTERRGLVGDVSPTPNTPTSPQLPPHSSSSSLKLSHLTLLTSPPNLPLALPPCKLSPLIGAPLCWGVRTAIISADFFTILKQAVKLL